MTMKLRSFILGLKTWEEYSPYIMMKNLDFSRKGPRITFSIHYLQFQIFQSPCQ